jgi:hypothetical protein
MAHLKAYNCYQKQLTLGAAFAASFFMAQTAHADDSWQPYFLLDSMTLSESVSIVHLGDGKGNFNPSGQRAFTSNWLEAGVRLTNAWQLGLLTRYEQSYHYSQDFAEFYHLTSQNITFPVGKSYQLDFAAQAWRGTGARLSYQLNLGQHVLGIGGSLFNTDNLTNGQITGAGSALSDKTYHYQVNVDYQYESDKLFGRTDGAAPTGRGYALDLSLQGQGDWASYNIWVRDALGHIDWGNTPRTTATASPAVSSYDANGYLQVTPVLSGKEYASQYSQALSPWIDANVRMPISESMALQAAYREHYGYGQTGVGIWTKVVADGIGFLLYPESKTLSMQLRSGHWQYSLACDNPNPDQANQFWLTVGYR